MGQRLYPNPRRTRRRHAHPADRGLALCQKSVVDHTYADHVSILKFIEANWRLDPLSARSRDHLPNPIANPSDPYVPVNRPAIGNLMSLFAF